MTADDTSTLLRIVSVVLAASVAASCISTVDAQSPSDEVGEAAAEAAAAAAESGAVQGPTGRAIASLEPAACLRLLREREVPFERYDGEDAEAIETPVQLEGPLGGVRFEHAGSSRLHSLMDCRLVVALLRWAPVLRAAGVERIEHFSVFRPGARVEKDGSKSAHAAALAIDAGRFLLEDGTELEVETTWVNRDGDPCPARDDEEPQSNAKLRSVVCAAVAQDLFQVVVTPHHNAAHSNHVHLELVADVDWSWVR